LAMLNISAVIIDDEGNNIENLQSIINQWCTDISIVGIAKSAEDGINVIMNTKPDLVFLDIQMPDRSGFEVLKAFPKLNFEVIFVTAHDQYGIQAIKFSALDYILKPINVSELQFAIEKARSKLAAKEENLSI